VKKLPIVEIPQRAVLKKVPSGEIAIELGGDGVFLRFDCECLDALPYCKSVCCTLHGIDVEKDELENRVTGKANGEVIKATLSQLVTQCEEGPEMTRSSDSWCACNDRKTRLCGIYKDRPRTCREFHCTRGAGMRGWRLDLSRHLSHE
jgi:Fe-S-cluster containining protein